MAPLCLAKPGSVPQQPNQCLTAKSKKQLSNINGPLGMPVSMGEKPSQGDVSSDASSLKWLNRQTAGGYSKEMELKSEKLLHLCWS